MTNCETNQKEIIELIFSVEDMINKQKCWLDILNIVIGDENDNVINIGLILNEIYNLNTKIYDKHEFIIEKMHNIIKNLPA